MASGQVGNYFQGLLVSANSITLTASTESSPYVATNALDWNNPSTYWATTTTGADGTLVFDMGASPPSCVGLYIARMNIDAGVSGVRLQANATNVWTSPTIDNALTLTQDSWVNRIQGIYFFNPTTRAAIAHRYYRLKINSGTAVNDGSSSFKVPLALPIISPVEIDNRAAITYRIRRSTLRNILSGGQEQRAAFSVRQMTIELPWQWLYDPSISAPVNEEATMLSLSQDEDVPVVVCRNLNKSHQAYLCRRDGDITIESPEGVGASMPLLWTEII